MSRECLTRIGIIGDVHAEHERLDAALDFLTGLGVDAILCTGDVADGPGDLALCCRLLMESEAHVVRGNHDRWLLRDQARGVPDAHCRAEQAEDVLTWLSALPSTLTFETRLGPLLLCHGVAGNDLRKVWPGTPRLGIERSAELDALIAEDHVRLVINGHMHYRVMIDFDNLTLINAGTLRGVHRPGLSVIDGEAGTVAAYEFEGARPRICTERLIRGHAPRRIWRDTQEFDGRWTPCTLYA